MNYRASYAEETSTMVDALIKHGGLKPEEIAFFTQRDGYGDAGYIGGITALLKNGLKSKSQVVHGRYERNTLSVDNALADIILAEVTPKAIIMVGAYAPCARFIKLARESGVNALFLNVSFVGSAPLAKQLGENVKGVVVTQVVPHPENLSLSVVKEYRDALTAFAPDVLPSFGSLEGYIAAKIMTKALKTISGQPTRESLIDALEALGKFDAGVGHSLYFDANSHQASHMVWPTRLEKGKFVSFEWPDIASFIEQ
ncbi:ABC transporter substrate-binding protein [Shewanella woodyi]|uniref:ABC transporter substrate-binding protein n=1 Tax=Shewanella woodyi TaxID=60961 RepID=UPI0037492E11